MSDDPDRNRTPARRRATGGSATLVAGPSARKSAAPKARGTAAKTPRSGGTRGKTVAPHRGRAQRTP